MSGGRATVARKSGKDVRQAGDITAVAPEGHALTDHVFIECKHYADLSITSFLLNRKGTLANFWEQVLKEAKDRCKTPWLIAKENNRPTLLITEGNQHFIMRSTFASVSARCTLQYGLVKVWFFDEVLEAHPKEYVECLQPKPASPSLPSTGTELSRSTQTVGRVRL